MMRTLLRFTLLLILLGGLAIAALAWDAYRQVHAPLPVAQPTEFQVPPGTGLRGVLRQLQREGLMPGGRLPSYTAAYAKLTGVDRLLQAGEYQLMPGMSAADLLALLASGKTKLYELTIVEGWRFQQLLSAVRMHPALRQTLPDADQATLMAALGHPGLHPEGRFLPETYRFPRGTTDVEFLGRALRAMEETLQREWETRAADLPYREPYEALIMASIIERETGAAHERPQIAGVFVRRLRLGMRLQTDPTVIYGLGDKFDGNLRRRDLITDTPYNSYTRSGLPPTPICLPGQAAINAALNPAPGDAIFFVSRGDGTHHFSATLSEHNAAVRKYQLRR